MPYYRREKELEDLLARCLRAIIKYDNPLAQELGPFTGEPNRGGNEKYTPTALICIEAAKRVLFQKS